MGKILAFIASIFGMIIVSLIVVTVTNTLQMTNVEGKAFTVIKKLNSKNQLKEKAAFVITKSALLHLKVKNSKTIFKHEIIDLGDSIEQFQKYRRKYQNIKDMGQNQIDEILKEFTNVQKTNDEMIVYMSALASMVQSLKAEKLDLEKELLKEEGGFTESTDLKKIEKILVGMQNNKDLKSLKNQLILKEYVSFCSSCNNLTIFRNIGREQPPKKLKIKILKKGIF